MSKMEGGEKADNRNMKKWFNSSYWTYKLFLDDQRIISDIYPEGHELNGGKWKRAKDYHDFVKIILMHGLPSFISFDHDLSENAVRECIRAVDAGRDFNYYAFPEKTGKHCAEYLIEYCKEKNLTLPEYAVHSANPLGSKNIINILERFKAIQRAI